MLDSADAECVLARVTGDAYRSLIAWRDDADMQVMRAQIARDGRALVIGLEPSRGFRWITELPRPGEARPHYGSFGGGYEFWFMDGPGGWELRAENCAHRSIRLGLSAPLPPLLLGGGAVDVRALPEPPEGMRYSGARGLQLDGDKQDASEAVFSIHEEAYERLVLWSWTPARITQYQYLFVPLSVGCEIFVRRAAGDTQIHLTEGVGW